MRSPYSPSMTFFMSLKATFGAASRNSASFAWNSSRYSSGTRPTSRNDMTWPSFIAAPFIVPSAATICSAVSSWRRARARCLPSSERATFVARVPICLAACVAASRPTFEDRLRREVGIASFFGMLLSALHLRAGDDVVAPVGPADPRLVPAVVVVAPHDERRRVAPDGDLLLALGVDAAPYADERVVLPLVADRRGLGVAGVDLGRRIELHEAVHDRRLDVVVG